ncbi:MAG: cobalamin biosynthesis protein [Lachnospiraceae bacterium]|nr:cobalamin biosynthesis protein [Lachnospiraceae bacterium]
MILRVCTFTKQGEALSKQLFDAWDGMIAQRRGEESLEAWVRDCFAWHLPILFIGACGIAVRAIAPCVQDKLSDSAVLVMDEKGEYVIPILSGHAGGANALARQIAERIGAKPVITTATDVEGLFSVDVFAVNNGLRIANREGIRKVSSKLLAGEKVTIAWDKDILCEEGEKLPEGLERVLFEEPLVDVRIVTSKQEALFQEEERQNLLLVSKDLILGMGCKKGKSAEELLDFLSRHIPKDWEKEAAAIASIDLKAKEEGLLMLSALFHLPFLTFSGEALEKVPGTFTESEFVRETTGVGNVCERAALCAAGDGGEIILQKKAEDGMTLAVARRIVRLQFGSKA